MAVGPVIRNQQLPSSSPAAPSLPDPPLDEHRTVVGELIPHRFVLLTIGHLAERGAIDPGHDPPVDDEVIDELRERIVPAAHGHLLGERGEIRIGRFAIVEVGPDLVIRLIEPAVEVPQRDERPWLLRRFVDPAFQDGHLCQQCLAGRAGRGVPGARP